MPSQINKASAATARSTFLYIKWPNPRTKQIEKPKVRTSGTHGKSAADLIINKWAARAIARSVRFKHKQTKTKAPAPAPPKPTEKAAHKNFRGTRINGNLFSTARRCAKSKSKSTSKPNPNPNPKSNPYSDTLIVIVRYLCRGARKPGLSGAISCCDFYAQQAADERQKKSGEKEKKAIFNRNELMSSAESEIFLLKSLKEAHACR